MTKNYPKSIVDVFAKFEKEYKKKSFVISDKTITYGKLFETVSRLAGVFKNLGLSTGDLVVFSTKDDIFASILFISLLRNGITAVFLDAETKSLRAHNLIELVNPKAIILDKSLITNWELINESPIIPIREEKISFASRFLKQQSSEVFFQDSIEKTSPAKLPDVIDPSLIAYILFTSGTTSNPKGVCITHYALFNHMQTLSRVYDLSPESRILNTLILSHADGMIQGPVLSLFNGASWYRPFRFSIQHIEDILDTIYREQISHFIAVPTILSFLCRFGKSLNDSFQNGAYKFTVSCGAQLEASLWKEFGDLFNNTIVNVYGLTETVAGGIFAGSDKSSHKLGTIGKPVDCKVKIVDENGCEVNNGESGELLIKGNNLMSGYLKAPEATADILKDGWLYTGDIALQEENGCYRILGRKKSIIISGGMNIHPGEISEVLNSHPLVYEAETFGQKDDVWGEKVISAVVLIDGENLSEVDLMNYCRKHLEEKKIPSAIYFLDILPKGRSEKVLQENLRKEIEQHKSRFKNNKFNSIETQLLQLASDCFKVDMSDISLDTSEEEIQEWDSLGHLSLVAEVEQTFAIQMTPAEVINAKTLRDIFVICNEKMSN